MEDREAQFFVAVADLCTAASLGDIRVAVATVTGRYVTGVPEPAPPARRSSEELDETGYARALLVDDEVIDLAEVRSCTIIAPHVD